MQSPFRETCMLEPLAVNAPEAARLVGVCRSTWMKMRAADQVPAPIRLGRCVRWRVADLEEWVRLGCPNREQFEAMRNGGAR